MNMNMNFNDLENNFKKNVFRTEDDWSEPQNLDKIKY